MSLQLLISLLEYLSASDRRAVSQSCKRFLEIWLRKTFSGDRCLAFKDWSLNPTRDPYTLLMNSKRNYDYLKLKRVEGPKDDEMICGNLWEKLGETVTTIDIESWYSWPDFGSTFRNSKL